MGRLEAAGSAGRTGAGADAVSIHLEQKGFNMVEVRQHSSVLHPPTKLLQELVESRRFSYEKNPLLEINFQNARVTEDTNRNKYVNKKRSKGKVDMVISLIIALYLLQQDVIFDQMNFVAQVG
jgi:phage terminase large subunit-like protein